MLELFDNFNDSVYDLSNEKRFPTLLLFSIMFICKEVTSKTNKSDKIHSFAVFNRLEKNRSKLIFLS